MSSFQYSHDRRGRHDQDGRNARHSSSTASLVILRPDGQSSSSTRRAPTPFSPCKGEITHYQHTCFFYILTQYPHHRPEHDIILTIMIMSIAMTIIIIVTFISAVSSSHDRRGRHDLDGRSARHPSSTASLVLLRPDGTAWRTPARFVRTPASRAAPGHRWLMALQTQNLLYVFRSGLRLSVLLDSEDYMCSFPGRNN